MSQEPDLERPPVTISAPGWESAPPADVLGEGEPTRRLPAWATPFVLGALAAVVAVPPAVRSVQEDRRADRAAHASAQRDRDAAAAVSVTDPRLVVPTDPDSVDVAVPHTVDVVLVVGLVRGEPVVVRTLQLLGGPFAGRPEVHAHALLAAAEAPAEVRASVPVDCTAVAAAFEGTDRPTGMAVVLGITSHAGRELTTRPLALPDAETQRALLDACGRGDPAVPPTALVHVAGSTLSAVVTVGNGEPVDVLSYRLPGVTLEPSTSHPLRVRHGHSFGFTLEVVQVDCALIGRGPLVVIAKKVEDGEALEVVATRGDPEGASLEDFLAALKRSRCR